MRGRVRALALGLATASAIGLFAGPAWGAVQPPSEQTPGATPTVQGTPQIGVSATRAVSGRAELAQVPRCAARRYRLTVRGRAMRSISVSVNGRALRTVRVRRGQTLVTVAVKRAGTAQRVRAQVAFDASAHTAARTLRATILPCAPGSARPSVTG